MSSGCVYKAIIKKTLQRLVVVLFLVVVVVVLVVVVVVVVVVKGASHILFILLIERCLVVSGILSSGFLLRAVFCFLVLLGFYVCVCVCDHVDLQYYLVISSHLVFLLLSLSFCLSVFVSFSLSVSLYISFSYFLFLSVSLYLSLSFFPPLSR